MDFAQMNETTSWKGVERKALPEVTLEIHGVCKTKGTGTTQKPFSLVDKVVSHGGEG